MSTLLLEDAWTVPCPNILNLDVGLPEIMSVPFEAVHVDHTELTRSSSGNKYIISFIDRATGWPEMKAVRDNAAASTAKALVELIVARHGVPKFLISDRGGAFISDLLKEFSLRCGFSQNFTTAYHPQSNGVVERRNRVIKEMLRTFCSRSPKKWDLFLHAFLFAIRNSPREGLPYSRARSSYSFGSHVVP